MKILYVTTISNTINAFLIPHIKMLKDEGHQVDIACKIDQEINPNLKNLVTNIYNINFNRSPLKYSNVKAYKKIKKIIKRERYGIVHTHTPVASTIVRLACKNIPYTKVLYTAHGFHFYKDAPIKNWLIFYPIEKFLSKYTDCLITINNEDFNTAINKKFKAKEIKKVHGVGVDLSKFFPVSLEEKILLRKKHHLSENDFILIYPAELNKNKNQILLINTIEKLKNKIPNIKLILAGTGELFSSCKKKVEEIGLSDKIIFTGYRNDIHELIKLSDLSVASSYREGLPVNILEAMACGLPVIATKNRGHNELIQDNKNGFLVDIDNPEEFANAIYKLYSNKNNIKKMGCLNLKIIKKYSIDTIKDELKFIYKSFIC